MFLIVFLTETVGSGTRAFVYVDFEVVKVVRSLMIDAHRKDT